MQKDQMIAFVIAFISSYLLFPDYFESNIYPVAQGGASWSTLDPSWQLMLNKANLDHLKWGTDITFTYGPLGYLSTRIGWGINKYHLLLFDLFVLFNFAYIFYTAYLKANSKPMILLIIAAVLIALPIHFGSGNALVLSAFLLFWIRQSLEKNNTLFYVMQLMLVVVLFFVKFNTGLVSFVFFSTAIFYKLFFTKENKALPLVFLVMSVLFVFILAKLLNVELLPYILGGLNMVSGYNDIMYLNESYGLEFRFSLVIIVVLLFVFLQRSYFENEINIREVLILFLFTSSVYILYKQAFVRADLPHILDFYRFILLFVICLCDFYSGTESKRPYPVLIILICTTVFFAKARDRNFFNFKSRMDKTTYVDQFFGFTKTSGFHLFPNDNQIPKRVKEKIKNKTVDIYPWNIHLLIENKLNYRARPVPQSYTAYTPYLEDLNFELYNSVNAPEYVLYEFDAIDGRYPLFDESKLNLALLTNYSCVDTFNFSNRPVLLLEKNKNTRIDLIKDREFELKTSDKIQPDKNKYYEIYISTTLKGKFAGLLYHAPEINLTIETKNGLQREYKISKKLLETGIFSTHFFESTIDFWHTVNNDSLKSKDEVVAYRLNPRDTTLFKNKIKIIEYKIIR